MILHDAAKAIIRARDYRAEHGRYDPADYHPGEDQSFDDWAADILETAVAADAAPDMLAALGTALGLITKHGLAVELAKSHPKDFARLEAARAVHAKAEGR